MKTLTLLLLAVSTSAFAAAPTCWVNTKSGHTDLTIDTAPVQVGAPFGEVMIFPSINGYTIHYKMNGIRTSLQFKKRVDISLSAEIPGKFYTDHIGNLVCY